MLVKMIYRVPTEPDEDIDAEWFCEMFQDALLHANIKTSVGYKFEDGCFFVSFYTENPADAHAVALKFLK